MQRRRCYLLGERAVVLELEPPLSLESQQRIWGLADSLLKYETVQEVVPGMNNITVILREPHYPEQESIIWLEHCWEQSEAMIPVSRQIDIPVVYGGEGGPDLAFVASHTGLTQQQVAQRHASVEYVVYFLGFQPGFAYLGGLPPELATPRRAEPRLKFPAGSVAIGGSQTAVYPLATPGGWQIIGHTSLSLFNPSASPPTLLSPGDRVRFVPQKESLC